MSSHPLYLATTFAALAAAASTAFGAPAPAPEPKDVPTTAYLYVYDMPNGVTNGTPSADNPDANRGYELLFLQREKIGFLECHSMQAISDLGKDFIANPEKTAKHECEQAISDFYANGGSVYFQPLSKRYVILGGSVIDGHTDPQTIDPHFLLSQAESAAFYPDAPATLDVAVSMHSFTDGQNPDIQLQRVTMILVGKATINYSDIGILPKNAPKSEK